MSLASSFSFNVDPCRVSARQSASERSTLLPGQNKKISLIYYYYSSQLSRPESEYLESHSTFETNLPERRGYEWLTMFYPESWVNGMAQVLIFTHERAA